VNDQEIDALIAAAAVSDEQVASLPLGGLVTELREHTMMNTRSPLEEQTIRPLRPHRRRVFAPRRFALAAAAIAVAVGVITVNTNGPTRTPYTPELIAFAEGSPRLLLRADGWQITQVNEFNARQGEMRFGLNGAVFGGPLSPGGENTLELSWKPAPADGSEDFGNHDRFEDVTIAGYQAELFKTRGVDTFTARWLQGERAVELRADRTSEADYRTLVAAIEAVDVDTWLDALPASFVRPGDRNVVISELRSGIPTPAGFDESVWDNVGVTDRDALASHVTGTIACAWIEQYQAADSTGDAAAKREAAAALAAAHDWPALREMEDKGFAQVLWSISDRIVNTGVVGPRGGPDTEGYVNALCLPR
jgi:hypothetical protein